MLDLSGRIFSSLPTYEDDEEQPPGEQDPAMRGRPMHSRIPGVKPSESPPTLSGEGEPPPNMGIAKFARAPGISGDAPLAPLRKPAPSISASPGAGPQSARPFEQVQLGVPRARSAQMNTASAPATAVPQSELADTISHVTRLRKSPDLNSQLAAAQASDRQRNQNEDVGSAMYAAFNREPVPPSRTPGALDELSQRLGVQRAQAQATAQSEEGNPASETSKSLQALVRGSMPALAEKMGPSLDRLSARQLKQMLPFVTELAKQNKPTEPRESEAQKHEREAQAGLAKQKAYNLAHPAPHVEKPSEKLAGIRTQLGQAKLGALEATDFEKDDPNATPLHEGEAPRLMTHRAAVDALSGLADELKGEYEKSPKTFSATDAAGRMKVMQAQLQPQITAAGGFGNFTQGHQELTSALAEPASWQNWLNSGRLPAQLEQIKKDARSNLDAHAHSLGRHFSPKGGGLKSHAAVGPATGIHPDDSAAVAWAKAHPDDPRSEKILSLNP